MGLLHVLNKLTRGSEWWAAKISPLLAVVYAGLALNRVPAQVGLVFITGWLFSMICLASFGHFVNDSFDIDADRRAGKRNAMAALARWQRFCVCALAALLGAIPWLFLRPQGISLMLLALLYVLQPLYAMPPLRLKERGFWGILTDAVYVLAVTSAFAAAMSAQVSNAPDPLMPLYICLVSLWALFFGLR